MPSIINATTSTGLVTTADNSGSLQLATNNGTTAVTIDTSQNVGIGTTSSGNKLVLPNNQYLAFKNSTGGETAYIGMTSANLFNFSDRMGIDSVGRVTMPFQPGFRAGLQGSTPSIAAGGIWQFDTASGNGRFNTGGHYNTSTYTFTAPIAGRYYFHIQVILEGNANNTTRTDMIVIQLNGAVVAYSERRGYYVANTTGDNGFYVDNVTAILQLSAGDNVRGANNSGAATQHANGVYSIFEGYLLG
jgi:hypothetical protein